MPGILWLTVLFGLILVTGAMRPKIKTQQKQRTTTVGTLEDVQPDEAEDFEDGNEVDEEMDDLTALQHYQQLRTRRAFGKNDYLLPENFRSLRRKDIPVTYRLHDDLLRYYRKGTRPVTHPNKIVHVQMTTFLYQIIKLDAVKNTISLSGSFELS
uniref:Neurotransmitter-gated ion-channel ligand-binding domain-containing protein n=1 Tax=Panagrolaimus sp. JU765 TaxID=591449 RepID=A0AC34QNA3_9BILA